MTKNTFFFLFLLMTVSCTTQVDQQQSHLEKEPKVSSSLKSELEKYNGYYSEVESQDGKLNAALLPTEIVNFRKEKITEVKIAYLQKITNGYNLQFKVDYSGYQTLVVSTLDENYSIVDFKIYPNGTKENDPQKDTISVLTYSDNTIIVQLMPPNLMEEPEFDSDGIRQEVLTIGNDLKLETIKQKTN